MDEQFILVVELVAKKLVRFDVVTATAEALLTKKSLSRDRIASVIRTTICGEMFDLRIWRDEEPSETSD